MDRRLFVLRHAKSSWDDPSLADHDRPLSQRGARALPTIAASLAELSSGVDAVLCSSAARTVATLDGIRDVLPDSAEVMIERELYGASRDRWLERCRAIPDDAGEVLLIGHNPALEELVEALTTSGEPDALAQLETKFPTGALAVLQAQGPWRELRYLTCHLAALPIPRGRTPS